MQKMIIEGPRIIVALDFSTEQQALDLVAQLDPTLCRLKVGKEMFTHYGPAFVEKLMAQGFEVFLDLKFHDIPNTVAKACRAAAEMGVWMVNVHALGGRKMMEAAKESVLSASHQPLLIGVTILTSMSDGDLLEIGLSGKAEDNVRRLANLAKKSGLDGVVCSPLETTLLKSELGQDFSLITPGVRPLGSEQGDQQRVMTPAAAINAGSDYLVIGRPITQADNPITVLNVINQELGAVLA